MSLLKDLKEKRQDAVENVATQDADMSVTREQLADQQRIRDHWTAQIADLDKAIAALEPATIEPTLAWVEPPTAAEPDEPAEHISILTGDPAIEPESGLHGDPVVTEIKEPEQPVKPAATEHPDAPFWARAFTRASVDA